MGGNLGVEVLDASGTLDSTSADAAAVTGGTGAEHVDEATQWPVVPSRPDAYVHTGDEMLRCKSGKVPHATWLAWASEQVALPAVKTVLLRGMYEAVRFWPWREEDFRMMYPDFSVKSWLRGGHDGLCGVKTQAFPIVCRGDGTDEVIAPAGAMLGPADAEQNVPTDAYAGGEQQAARRTASSDLRRWGRGGDSSGRSAQVCLPAVPKRWIPPHRFGPIPEHASDVRPGVWYVRRVAVDHVSIVPA